MICPASSRSSTFAIRRPHEPTGGFRTAGYPTSSRALNAASGVRATTVLGAGTPPVEKRPGVAALLPPVLFFLRGRVDAERLQTCDLELDPAVRAGEDLPLDQLLLLDRSSALRAFRHGVSSFRIRSPSSTHSACLDREYRSSPIASWARASCARTVSGA